MISYELAKKLKELGFPQKAEDLLIEVEYNGQKYVNYTIPTLEELIEACGDKFRCILKQKELALYEAYSWDFKTSGVDCFGSTPLEAVANLWISLNKKDI